LINDRGEKKAIEEKKEAIAIFHSVPSIKPCGGMTTIREFYSHILL